MLSIAFSCSFALIRNSANIYTENCTTLVEERGGGKGGGRREAGGGGGGGGNVE